MRARIVSDWAEIDGQPAHRAATPHQGGRQTPTLIVLHDTAGRLTPGSSVDWFLDPASKVSAHFVVERDGAVTQLVACDRQAWHAGKSSWQGRGNVNGFSVGIEIVNPGILVPRGEARAVAWFGETYDRKAMGIRHVANDTHGDGLWMPYTDAQIASVKALVAALSEAYPSIREVVGHFQISPGRKVDVNPLIPDGLLGPVRRPRLAEPDGDEVASAQQRLADLGYFPGYIDGALGARTEAAVFAFQRQNGLPATGRLDADTLAKLHAVEAKEMPTAAREHITEADLAGQSRIVDEQRGARSEGQAQAAVGFMMAFLAPFTALGHVIKDAVADFGPGLVLALGGVLAVIGVRQWQRSSRTIGYRVADARSGAHLGAGGTGSEQ